MALRPDATEPGGGHARATSGPGGGPWGILGGTFDPPHHAHLAIAEAARRALGLRGVVFVPARLPPHKLDRDVSDAAERLRMVELAIGGRPGCVVDDLELHRDGPSYTVDTAEALRQKLGTEGGDPWFILSVEQLWGLPGWHRPQRLVELVRVAAVPRPGAVAPEEAWFEHHFPGAADRFRLLDGPVLGHSSTEIRRLAAAGEPIDHLVPAAVARHIREHGLYRPAAVPAGATMER